MSFVDVTKKCGQNSKVHYLLVVHDFDLFIFGSLIMVALDKLVLFYYLNEF
jgi:hypothetical protein